RCGAPAQAAAADQADADDVVGAGVDGGGRRKRGGADGEGGGLQEIAAGGHLETPGSGEPATSVAGLGAARFLDPATDVAGSPTLVSYPGFRGSLSTSTPSDFPAPGPGTQLENRQNRRRSS